MSNELTLGVNFNLKIEIENSLKLYDKYTIEIEKLFITTTKKELFYRRNKLLFLHRRLV